MSFAWPWMLAFLPLPWLLRRWWPATTPTPALRVPSVAAFATGRTEGSPTSPPEVRQHAARRWFVACAWALLLVAAARPQGLADPAQVAMSGRDLMIALDVSASMATRDLDLDGRPVERLHAARTLARDFVLRRDGDRIGLIVFGSETYLHTPLTWDIHALADGLSATGTGLAGRETAIGDAIGLAVRRMREQSGNARVLILLTDGANTAGKLTPEQASWIAQREGVRIHVVGIGSNTARPSSPEAAQDSSADLDERTLRSIAEQTGGSYHRATDAAALAAFYREIESLEPIDGADAIIRTRQELYPWPLGAALACALLLGALGRHEAARRRS
ncbi:VWA domain-containing protein [Aromatoleum evansii]|uniref:VWA domain-containing protein n=1 Tax=Aromatoleum evansii TaxID=59406 RepID=UPI00145CC37F|nr:VWA domain-containing protein [Aromatoleum evansii]NMG31980.1 VWA domain-containing protein [Aromatoleum evansii]